MDFEVLIMGCDANAYYMARCTHEEYGKKAWLIAKEEMAFTKFSDILNITYEPNLWDENTFLEAIYKFKKEHSDKTILLISSNENYARFIAKNEKKLAKDFVFNYADLDILSSLIMKDNFYAKYKDFDIDMPKTLIYSCKKEKNLILDGFVYPIIIKPADVIEYYKHKFPGMRKVYRLNSIEEIVETIKEIKENGYEENLIIQEFIPGDDSALFDCVFYCDRLGRAKLASFAQIGLQEHTKTAVGNATVLINGFNEYGNPEETILRLKKFMEKIKYKGWAEFDLKYDYRDQKYKVFEINARQGRSSYYVAACGYNLVKYLVDDLINNKKLKFTIIKEEVGLSFVPKKIIKKYISNEKFKKEILSLYKKKKVINPLSYKKDKGLKRKLFLIKFARDYTQKYKYSEW